MRDLEDSSPFQPSTCIFFYFLADPPPQDKCALPSHVNHMFSDTTAVLAIMNCLLEWETKTTLLHGSALAPPPASHTSKHTEDTVVGELLHSRMKPQVKKCRKINRIWPMQ
jgi:hypothetical protein